MSAAGQLAQVIESMRQGLAGTLASLSRTLVTGDNPVMSVSEVVDGYVDHLEHHLGQISS